LAKIRCSEKGDAEEVHGDVKGKFFTYQGFCGIRALPQAQSSANTMEAPLALSLSPQLPMLRRPSGVPREAFLVWAGCSFEERAASTS